MFRQDQEIFNILLETVSEGVIIVDDHQKIVEANSALEHIFGYSSKNLINNQLNLLIPSHYHNNLSEYFKKFLERGKRRKLGEATDIFALKKDGDMFPVEVELNPFSIYNKTYVMVLVKDISEKKEIERNLMLRTKALQSANNGIVITDALKYDNPIMYFNAAFQKLTGYADYEILNRNCRFLQGIDRNQADLIKLREAIKNGESCQATLRNYKKDGTMFWNDIYVFPITNIDGVVTNFIGIQNDVTLRKKVEDERHHLAAIFDESLNEIHVFDAKTLKFINMNFGAQKSLGYTMDELLKMTPIHITPYKDELEFRKVIDVLLDKTVEKLEIETVQQRKDGTEYPVEVHLQLSNLGEREVFVAIILDITERKNYTAKLEKTVEERTQQLKLALNKEKELNDLKTNFLSLVSHEFKTPLSGILSSSELLSRYQLTEHQEKRDKYIKNITDKVYYLNNILTDFLSVEKLEKGKASYSFTHFKLSKVVNEVVYNANMLLKDGQQIKYPENVDEISLYQDEKIIQLILTNLLHNAIKYSPEGAFIYMYVTQDENLTTVIIKDNGVGIPEKDQKNIFQRYFRAQNVVNTQGTGIGLNIVKSHCENLGGSISFESEEHKGSTFTITIPNKAINET
ncbi:PAS domain S-box-containing protein [Mariniflexile fucanivorans]|uniref:histidine kinase n=1 Tax=Mariniflexile fucanivorans TaxID=264023 RepID=A0A4R1RIJ2_9FLAO|nr:PAS domain-containing sensor histidine kinase [Mariniflexile fucanivorans]TCL65590.1 PAS domain S-box-containing protein [Mariniflexile fucanivorans]